MSAGEAGPAQEFSPARAAQVLATALAQPGAAPAVLGGFAALPGAIHIPARPGGFLRSAVPAALHVGQWRFVADTPMQVSHIVRGIVLQTSTAGPAQAGRLLADALLSTAADAGPTAVEAVQSMLFGIAVVHGLA